MAACGEASCDDSQPEQPPADGPSGGVARRTVTLGTSSRREIYGDLKAVYSLGFHEEGEVLLAVYRNGKAIKTAGPNVVLREFDDCVVSEPCDQAACAVWNRQDRTITVESQLMAGEAGNFSWLEEWADGGMQTTDEVLMMTASASRQILCAVVPGATVACKAMRNDTSYTVSFPFPENSVIRSVAIWNDDVLVLNDGIVWRCSPPKGTCFAAYHARDSIPEDNKFVDLKASDRAWCVISNPSSSVLCSVGEAPTVLFLGQLGNNTNGTDYAEPIAEVRDWVGLSTSGSYACAWTIAGEWGCWGYFTDGNEASSNAIASSEMQSLRVYGVSASLFSYRLIGTFRCS